MYSYWMAMHVWAFSLSTFTTIAAVGCGDSAGESATTDNSGEIGAGELRSAHRLLGPSDLEKFLPGRSRSEILNGIQWRGNFEMGCEHHGDSLCAISYELFGTDPEGGGGEVVWAIFVGNKFEKFVPWPKWEMVTVLVDNTPSSRPKPIKIGDFSRLLRAANSKPINLAKLETEVKARPEPPSQIDPGLTIAYLLIRAAAPEGSLAATKRDLERNAELRDQFNAARLEIGMTEFEVEKVFNSKPIISGKMAAGTVKLFGSTESFNISFQFHYSNVLALFKGEKLVGVYSGETVPGGENGLRDLRDLFSDFPK